MGQLDGLSKGGHRRGFWLGSRDCLDPLTFYNHGPKRVDANNLQNFSEIFNDLFVFNGWPLIKKFF